MRKLVLTVASNEATGGACGEVQITHHVADSNCLLHANAAGVEMYGHSIFGETLAIRCDHEFSAAVDDNGEGAIGPAVTTRRVWKRKTTVSATSKVPAATPNSSGIGGSKPTR